VDRTNALLYALLLAVVGNAAAIAGGDEYAGVGGLLLVVALLFGTGAFFAKVDEGSAAAADEGTTERSDSDGD
jgi:hypothetical protein